MRRYSVIFFKVKVYGKRVRPYSCQRLSTDQLLVHGNRFHLTVLQSLAQSEGLGKCAAGKSDHQQCFGCRKRLRKWVWSGILRCTILMMVRLTVRDSVSSLPAEQYSDIYAYDVMGESRRQSVVSPLIRTSPESRT